MIKEGQTHVPVINKFTGNLGKNNVDNICPTQDDVASDGSNHLRKEFKNVLENFCNDTKEYSNNLKSNDDTIDSSIHSEVQYSNYDNETKICTEKNNDSPKNVNYKGNMKQDFQHNTFNNDENTSTGSSESVRQDFFVNKSFLPHICEFSQLQICHTCGLNRNDKTAFHTSENRNDLTCHTSRKNEPQLFDKRPNSEFHSDPNYKLHTQCCPSNITCCCSQNWQQFRYHNSHKYLRPWNYQKSYKMHQKFSHLKQKPSGVIGNLVHNVGHWYSSLKHSGEGDREELYCCPERLLSAESLKLLYKAKIEKNEDSDPERITFNKVSRIPKYNFTPPQLHNINFCHYSKRFDQSTHNVGCGKELSNEPPFIEPTAPYQDSVLNAACRPHPVQPERMDFYYFDQGDPGYYCTTDRPPPLCTEILVERTDEYATKFWAEIFGACHIMIAFITTFLLQLYRFLLYSLVRPTLVGFFQLSSDYFFKPLLTTAFNGFIQPIFILLYNIATSFRDLCKPTASSFGYFIHEIAQLLKAIRLVDVNTTNKNGPFYYPHQPA